MKVIIIGAGAAGCFAAIEMKRRHKELDVEVLEAGTKPLAKVLLTGGGRCNLTNSFRDISGLESAYPRGHRLLKRLFHRFSPEQTMEWWEQAGVQLITQDDQCVFPRSQKAGEVAGTLLRLMQQHGIRLTIQARVQNVQRVSTEPQPWQVATQNGRIWQADKVVVAVGGRYGKLSQSLEQQGVEFIPPVPSLFSLKLNDASLTRLMGLVVEHAQASIPGTKFKAQGPLLITHWGMSGPAILKLSSYAARWLDEKAYTCALQINWMPDYNEAEIKTMLEDIKALNPQKQMGSAHPCELQGRLWAHLLEKAGICATGRWKELAPKSMNRLVNTLIAGTYQAAGRNRSKEEFVTCGGAALGQLNPSTLEHKHLPGLYFAGEALDVDAITGGFNLQAAWTTGYAVAEAIASHET